MTLLVLAGTSDARRALAQLRDGAVCASLAGVTRAPADLGVPTRIGGYGGEAGFADHLRAHRIAAVLDMTHPYARDMPRRSAGVCAKLGVPYLRYLRPPWQPVTGDLWTQIDSPQDVVLPPEACVFLATGGLSHDTWRSLYGHVLWVRRVDDAGPAPWPRGGFMIGPPGPDCATEMAMMREKGITHMIAKNAGGRAGYAKMEAARALQLPVFVLARPQAPDAQVTQDVDAAIAWGRAHAL